MTLDVHIAWLRAALGADPRTPATSAPSAASACASPGRGNRRRLRLRRFASMLQLSKSALTTLADGHSPSLSRWAAAPRRRLPCVRDQS